MATISKECWQAIQHLFDQALDLPESERNDFVNIACADTPELKPALLELLQAEKKSSTFLDKPAQDIYTNIFEDLNSQSFSNNSHGVELTDTIIGPFRLSRELGRGGMGTVYLAERITGDFDQSVAIKILANNSKDKDVLERFKREQQLLASLDHPNIAKLYDGGVNEDDLAYLTMEYVDGVRIDQYCQNNNLGLNSRLHLIQQVASAVGFAHKHLVIHRDLKPSNILVKRDGTVKLLDFGIAKPFDIKDSLELTELNRTPMTPGFAAPEQLQNLTISVATDIYQLGLVSYHILTGMSAHADAEKSLASLVKQVCEELPPAPSRALISAGVKRNPKGEGLSKTETPQESKFAGKLHGDLDAIVLKMLQIKPEDRYPSIDSFQTDLNSYFQNKPVVARRASWAYFSKRFLRRHWKASLISVVFVFTLIGYALTITWQRDQIENAFQKSREEQAKSEQVTGFLINVFKAADPNVSGFDSVTAKQLLENGEQRIFEELHTLPGVRNHMLNIFAQIWQRQGNFSHAQSVLDKARNLEQSPETISSTEFAKTLSLTGINHLLSGENELALKYTQQGLAMYDALLLSGEASIDDEYAYLLVLNAQALDAFGRHEDAKPLVLKAIDILKQGKSSNNEYLSYAYSELALIQHMSGIFELARENMEKAADLQKMVTGENHTYYTTLITNLSILYQDAEQFDQAEKLARKSLRIHETIFGPNHSLSLHSQRHTAVILHRNGNLSEAESLLRKVVKHEASIDQYSSNERVSSILQLGSVLTDAGNYQEAESAFMSAKRILDSFPNNNLLARALTKLASLKYQQKVFSQALSFYDQALALYDKPSILTSAPELGKSLVLIESGRSDEALDLAKNALKARQVIFAEDHSWVTEAELIYALALMKSTQAQTDTNEKNMADNFLNKILEKAKRSPGFLFGERLRLYNLANSSSGSANK